MINKDTFGGSRASEVLVDILSKYSPKQISKVGKLLTLYDFTIKEISKLNSKVSIGLINLVYKDTLAKCDEYPDKIPNYLKNVLAYKRRIALKKIDSLTPYKSRMDYLGKQKNN